MISWKCMDMLYKVLYLKLVRWQKLESFHLIETNRCNVHSFMSVLNKEMISIIQVDLHPCNNWFLLCFSTIFPGYKKSYSCFDNQLAIGSYLLQMPRIMVMSGFKIMHRVTKNSYIKTTSKTWLIWRQVSF